MDKRLIMKIAVTYELVGGREPSNAVKAELIKTLEKYEPIQVSNALDRCKTEIKGHLSLSDIITRIDDGRPEPSTAWEMMPKSEDETCVMTDEMSMCLGCCTQLIDSGDHIAARMAFVEEYKKQLSIARAAGYPVRWRISLGNDKNGRVGPISNAYSKRLISAESAIRFLPETKAGDEALDKIQKEEHKRLLSNDDNYGLLK